MLLPLISLTALARRLRRFRRSRSGSTAVEFAMVAPVFFALIFAVMETGMVFMAGQLLENGVQDGARLAYTSDTVNVTDFKKVICARVSMLMDCTKLDFDVRSYNPGEPMAIKDPIDSGGKYVPGGFVFQPPAYSATGTTNQTVVVRAFYQWPLYVTGLGYNLANIDRGTTAGKRLLAATTAVGPQ